MDNMSQFFLSLVGVKNGVKHSTPLLCFAEENFYSVK